MNNILVVDLPKALEIDGQDHKINTDYRASLLTILAFEDDELTQEEKVGIMLDNLYFDTETEESTTPDNIIEAIKKAQWFLDGGKEREKKEADRRLYSLSQDANFIYSAFKQTHNIDLQDVQLHWWKFLSLIMDLGQDTTYCQLVGLRSRFYDGKCTDEEKEHIAKIADIFYIDNTINMSAEEKEEERLFREKYEEAKEAQERRRSK
ncbi:MAG: hypothetical protein HOJ31_10305 [Anaerolineae bacterium]|mgnify:CR=1 FL=1|jgi:hypothetical protein|nr:hypothetical protein [Anaerolineae bacterium]